MSLGDRPYIGTWKLGAQKLVQHTPDALVYVNGDLAVPGCQRCSSNIDLQRFITEVSVDAGCDAAGASASISLSIPAHHRDSFIRDSQFILRAGLEIHVYMRGYFPVKGLYSNLNNTVQDPVKANQAPANTSVTPTTAATKPDPVGKVEPKPGDGKRLTPVEWRARYEADFRKVAEETYPGDQQAQDKFVAKSLVWSFNESGGLARKDCMMFGQKYSAAGSAEWRDGGVNFRTKEKRQEDGPEDGHR